MKCKLLSYDIVRYRMISYDSDFMNSNADQRFWFSTMYWKQKQSLMVMPAKKLQSCVFVVPISKRQF